MELRGYGYVKKVKGMHCCRIKENIQPIELALLPAGPTAKLVDRGRRRIFRHYDRELKLPISTRTESRTYFLTALPITDRLASTQGREEGEVQGRGDVFVGSV